MFKRKPVDSLGQERSRGGVGDIFKLDTVILAIDEASESAENLSVKVELFDFARSIEQVAEDENVTFDRLPQSELALAERSARGIFHKVDPVVLDVRKFAAIESIPILERSYLSAFFTVFKDSGTLKNSQSPDADLFARFALLLATKVVQLPSKPSKDPSAYRAFGELSFTVAWVIVRWLSSETRMTCVQDLERTAAWCNFVDSYSKLLTIPRDKRDLLVGLPERSVVGRTVAPRGASRFDLLINGYLAFQAGDFEVAAKLYEYCQRTGQLTKQRLSEFAYARHVLAGGAETSEGLALTVDSSQRIAFLTDGIEVDSVSMARLELEQDEIKEVNVLLEGLSGPKSLEAADRLTRLSLTGRLPLEVRAKLALYYQQSEDFDSAFEHLKVLVAVSPFHDTHSRVFGLGMMAMTYLKLRQYAQAQMAARETLRLNASDLVAIGILAKFESAVNLDFQMSTLLNLRYATIHELSGRLIEADSLRAQLRKYAKSDWPVGFDLEIL